MPHISPGLSDVWPEFPDIWPGLAKLWLGLPEIWPGLPKIWPGLTEIWPELHKIYSGLPEIWLGWWCVVLCCVDQYFLVLEQFGTLTPKCCGWIGLV